MRQAKVCCVLLGLLLAGTGCSQSDGESSDTTVLTPTTIAPASSSSTTNAVTTTVPTTTTTLGSTTTTVPMGFEVVLPHDGEWTDECEFIPIGVVRPSGVVTYRDHEMIDDGRFGPPYRLADGWHRWTHSGEPLPLDEGLNKLEFVASFNDGRTTETSVDVTCDPAAIVHPRP